jgi:hypothetical protein
MAMQKVADNLWIKSYPLSVLGGKQGRVVTIIRLASGELIIHSTGPFSPEDVTEIESLGRPGWMVDTMLRHDTFAKHGRVAFPTISYLAPEGFAETAHVDSRPLLPAPAAWSPEIRVLLIEGMPLVKEHVFLHIPNSHRGGPGFQLWPLQWLDLFRSPRRDGRPKPSRCGSSLSHADQGSEKLRSIRARITFLGFRPDRSRP